MRSLLLWVSILITSSACELPRAQTDAGENTRSSLNDGGPSDGGPNDAGPNGAGHTEDSGPVDCTALTVAEGTLFDCRELDDDANACAVLNVFLGAEEEQAGLALEKLSACGQCNPEYFAFPDCSRVCGDEPPVAFPTGYCLQFCGSDAVGPPTCVDGERVCTDPGVPQLGDDCPEGSYDPLPQADAGPTPGDGGPADSG